MKADARLLVDHLETVRSRFSNRLVDVVHGDRYVVQTWTAIREELADWRVLAQRLHQLDLRFAGAEKCRGEAILFVGGAMRQLGPEIVCVELDRCLEVLDRDADVMDLHVSTCTSLRRSCAPACRP